MTGRYAARLYAHRRRAIERNVPFWLPGEPGGQGGKPAGQGTFPANSLKDNHGQGGQGGQGIENATDPRENIERDVGASVRASLPVRAHGPSFYADHPDHPDRASNYAALSRTGYDPTILTTLTSPDDWTDDRAWISDWLRAGHPNSKAEVLAYWVNAAGGVIADGIARLPPLEHRLATVELRRMLRQSLIEIREGAEEGEAARLLADANSVVNNPDAWADEAEVALHGGPQS